MTFAFYLSGKTTWSLAISAALILFAAGCVHSHSDLETIQLNADRGNAEAEYKLAKRYERGEGVSKNFERAFEYLHRSAEQEYVYAETDLGSYYARGLGVQKDFSRALYWYRRAANGGDPLAQYCLGYAYANGDGAQKDIDQAVQWWRKAAEHGQAEAQNALGQFYFRGDAAGDTNRIDYVESAKWLGKAAAQNYVPSMNNLAFMYQNGWGVRKDLKQAFHWYQIAANKGDAMAQANLGLMYQDGVGVTPDMVEAYKWFMLSAEQRNSVGKHSFDDYNEHQRLTPEQFEKARQMVSEFHNAHPDQNPVAARFKRPSKSAVAE